jgi:hypothetical protein
MEIDAGGLVGRWRSNCEIVPYYLNKCWGRKRRMPIDRGLSALELGIRKEQPLGIRFRRLT